MGAGPSVERMPTQEVPESNVMIEPETGFYEPEVVSATVPPVADASEGTATTEPPLPAPAAASTRSTTYNYMLRRMTEHVPEEHLKKLSIYMAVSGALLVVVGVVGILFPFIFALAVEQMIGTLMVLGGIFSIVNYVAMYDVPGTSSFFLLGVLHLAIGVWMLLEPIGAGIMLIYILSGWLLAHGLLKSLMACQVRNMRSSPFVLISGLLSVVLSFMIIFLAPKYGLVLLGVMFGADFLVSGLSMVLIAGMTYLAKRRAEENREPLLDSISSV